MMPRSPDLAIFVLRDKQTDGQNQLLYPLHMRVGNKYGTFDQLEFFGIHTQHTLPLQFTSTATLISTHSMNMDYII